VKVESIQKHNCLKVLITQKSYLTRIFVTFEGLFKVIAKFLFLTLFFERGGTATSVQL